MSDLLESAIPNALICERSSECPVSTPAGYQPAYPSFCARFPENVQDMALVILGAQCQLKKDETKESQDEEQAQAQRARATLEALVRPGPGEIPDGDDGDYPNFWESATSRDKLGYLTVCVLAYWKSVAGYRAWESNSSFATWWQNLDATGSEPPHGWFREVFLPDTKRLETLFSDEKLREGFGHMRAESSNQVLEHVYFGSMRDRLPISQVDQLKGEVGEGTTGPNNPAGSGRTTGRVTVRPLSNLAVIRSGQDWNNVSGRELEMYLGTMRPTLVKGMDFLRDKGDEVGCYSCRFMDILPTTDAVLDSKRTFGLAYFHDLRSMEGWAKGHPTHQVIFGGFLQYAAELQGDVSLRVFHEVMVLRPDQQFFEYMGCHGQTGMMASLDCN